MASNPDFVQYVADQCADAGETVAFVWTFNYPIAPLGTDFLRFPILVSVSGCFHLTGLGIFHFDFFASKI